MNSFSHGFRIECGRLSHTPSPDKDVYVLIPRTCEFVILHGKKGRSRYDKLRMEPEIITAPL